MSTSRSGDGAYAAAKGCGNSKILHTSFDCGFRLCCSWIRSVLGLGLQSLIVAILAFGTAFDLLDSGSGKASNPWYLLSGYCLEFPELELRGPTIDLH